VLCVIGYYNYQANLSLLARSPQMSSDDFSRYVGVARTDIEDTGTVGIRGELWNARSYDRIPAGSEVVVEDVEGLTLVVRARAPHEGA
jgi:membrane-bound ClpP family serine protease